MVRKKPGKWFEDENIQRITVKGKNIYIGKKKKKEKANLVIPIEKNQKTRNWLVKRKKTHRKGCQAIYIYMYIYIYRFDIIIIVAHTFKWIHITFNIYVYYYYYYYTSCESCTPALFDRLSMEFERQQITSGLQDSSQYSVRFHQCCSLDGLDSSSDFQFFQSSSHVFGGLLHAHQLQLLLLWPSCSTAFF